jgi:hypothetical protein
MPTLLQLGGKNQTIKLEYSVNKTDKGAVGTAFVVDQLGNKAEVIAPNFFAGTVRGAAGRRGRGGPRAGVCMRASGAGGRHAVTCFARGLP